MADHSGAVLNPSADALHVGGTAFAAFEIASIARGIFVLDQMAKRAETTIVAARTVTPGKYFIVISGHLGEIEEACSAAHDAMHEDHIDNVIIRDPHPHLRDTLSCELEPIFQEALAIFELQTLCSCLLALDRTLKETSVQIVELRLGAGLSGKGVFTVSGALHMVEAACEVVEASVAANKIIRIEKISQIHEDLPKHLLGAEWPSVRGTKPS